MGFSHQARNLAINVARNSTSREYKLFFIGLKLFRDTPAESDTHVSQSLQSWLRPSLRHFGQTILQNI